MALTPLARSLRDVTISFLILSFVFILLRIATRVKQLKQKKKVWSRTTLLWSDITIVLSFLIYVPWCGIIFHALQVPGGSIELPDLMKTPTSVDYYVDILTVNTLLMTLVLAISKISILLFYRAIFITRSFQIINALTIALVSAVCVTTLFLITLRCSPPSATWIIEEEFYPTTKCIDYGIVLAVMEITNLGTDILILALPLNEMRKLQMRTSKKVGICLLFSLGAFVVFTCAIIISFTWGKPLVPFSLSFIWITVQLGCQIIGSCIPTLMPLVPDDFIQNLEILSDRLRLVVVSRLSGKSQLSTKKSQEGLACDERRSSKWYSVMNSPIDPEAAHRDSSWYAKSGGPHSHAKGEAINRDDVPLSPVRIPDDAIGVSRVVDVSKSAHSS